MFVDESADGDESAGQNRQGLPDVFEHLDHLGHHIAQQQRHHQQRHAGDEYRIDQRHHDLALHLLARLGVIGEALQHQIQVTGLFAGGHRGAVQIGKHMGEIAQGRRQGMALHEPRPHSHDHALDARLVALLRHRLQGLLDGQAGVDQGGELAADQGQICGADAALKQAAAPAPGLALLNLDDRQGRQPASRSCWRIWRGVSASSTPFCIRPAASSALNSNAPMGYSSWVTRNTSSSVVSPSSTRRRPSS